jgi:hypothetical protein
MLAGLIDAATVVVLFARYLRSIWRSGPDAGPGPDPVGLQRWLRPLAPAVRVLSEQLGTPGGWIVGLRTVDRRTGRRVALWRSLAVALLGAVTEAVRRRLTPASPPISESEHEDFVREVQAIRERHADDRQLLGEENRLYEERRIGVNLWRWLPATVGPALINSRLRRRLAPTVVVVSRPRVRHSP